jgi:hypothetical protein
MQLKKYTHTYIYSISKQGLGKNDPCNEMYNRIFDTI